MKNKLYFPHYLSVFIILIYFSPYLILREDAYICPYADNLDAMHLFKVIAESGKIFAKNTEIIPNGLMGIPRLFYPSEYFYMTWMFYFFKPFAVWVLNSILLSIIGYIGAFLLLKKHVLKYFYSKGMVSSFISDDCFYTNIISSGVALYFALIPHWIYGGVSIVGQPLLLYALLNLRERNTIRDWLIVILFPFFSSFIFSNIIFFPVLGILFLFLMIKNKKIYYRVAIALFLLFLLSFIVEYRLFYNEITHQIETQRNTLLAGEVRDGLSLWAFIKETILIITNNRFLFFTAFMPSFARTDALITACFIIAIALYFLLKQRYYKAILTFIIFIFTYLILTALTNPALIKTPMAILMPGLRNTIAGIRFRFENLSQTAWIVLYFMPIIWFIDNRIKLYIVISFFFINTAYQFAFIKDAEVSNNAFLNNYIHYNKPSYKAYFDTELFSEIDRFIQSNYKLNQAEYRVGTISLNSFFPIIPIYNHFMTIDGYYPVYPKSTYMLSKSMFGQLFDKVMRSNRKVYIIPKDFSSDGKIAALPLNYGELRKQNCKFLFSTVEIDTSVNVIKFVKKFDGLYWKVYLYEIK